MIIQSRMQTGTEGTLKKSGPAGIGFTAKAKGNGSLAPTRAAIMAVGPATTAVVCRAAVAGNRGSTATACSSSSCRTGIAGVLAGIKSCAKEGRRVMVTAPRLTSKSWPMLGLAAPRSRLRLCPPLLQRHPCQEPKRWHPLSNMSASRLRSRPALLQRHPCQQP